MGEVAFLFQPFVVNAVDFRDVLGCVDFLLGLNNGGEGVNFTTQRFIRAPDKVVLPHRGAN